MNICPNCGSVLTPGAKFCENCGQPVEQLQINNASVATKIKSKLPIIFKVVLPIVAVIIVISIFISIFSTASMPNYALYVKDGDLKFTSLSGIKPYEVTTDGYDGGSILTKDGKTLFFLEDDELCYRKAKNSKKQSKKISSNVESFRLSEDGKTVTYLKTNDSLYQSNLKDSEKIAGDIEEFDVSDDGKQIYYISDDELYYKKGKKEAVKIADDIDDDYFVFDDFNVCYYLKEDTLYKCKSGKDQTEIADDVSSVIRIYETGDVYYSKLNKNSSLRKLCYFNGKEEIVITNKLYNVLNSSYYDSSNQFIAYQENYDNPKYSVAVKDKVTNLDFDSVSYFYFDNNVTKAYFVADLDDGHGDLYEMQITNSKVKEPTKYDPDVYYGYIRISDNGKVSYFKDVNTDDYKGDLYVDKNKIDSDVMISEGFFVRDTNDFVYLDNDSTLKISKNKKYKEISQDVKEYAITPENDILYISNNDLLLYTGSKKSKEVDTNVSYIIPIYTAEDNEKGYSLYNYNYDYE